MTQLVSKRTQQLAAAVNANRRMLMLLDQQIDELGKIEPVVLAELGDPDRNQPYSYVVEGVDGKPGIAPPLVVANDFQNPNLGYIRVQSDAAFVATRMFVCVRKPFAVGGAGGAGRSIQVPSYDTQHGLQLRAYDESSQRWLFIANNRQRVQQNAAVPSTLLGPLAISSAGGIELPAECTFPRNALIRIEAYVQNGIAQDLNARVVFVLHGYKVFGG